jgi:hypothetical protein
VHPEIIEYAPLHSGRRAPWNDRANAAASPSVLIATLLEGIQQRIEAECGRAEKTKPATCASRS